MKKLQPVFFLSDSQEPVPVQIKPIMIGPSSQPYFICAHDPMGQQPSDHQDAY